MKHKRKERIQKKRKRTYREVIKEKARHKDIKWAGIKEIV